MSAITHAMILAAGLGTRMRPLTLTTPKPLIPVQGKALIDWNLDWLEGAGVDDVVINSSYLAEQLEAHVAQRASPRVVISREGSPPLETGGGVKKALSLLGEGVFLTMNSDAIFPGATAHPLPAMRACMQPEDDFLLLLVHRAQAVGWHGNGDFVFDVATGRVRRPQPDEDAPYLFTGVELMRPRAFVGAPEGAFSLAKLWQRGAAADGWFRNVRAMRYDGPWLNVGDLQGLASAEAYLSAA